MQIIKNVVQFIGGALKIFIFLTSWRYSYSHDCPRERSNSVISTLSSRMRQFGPSRDYPYSYPGDLSEEEQEIIDKEKEDEEDKARI